MPYRSVAVLASIALACVTTCGCGLGGTDTPAAPAAPGVFRTLAIQGQAAPGTAGAFGALPTLPLMDAASDGTCAFVAPTTDPVKTEVLYAVQPDGAVVPVFAVGDTVYPPADGQISGFGGTWVGPNGLVYGHVWLTGDSGARTFGILSAIVTSGAAGSQTVVLYDQAPLAAAGPAGLLEAVDVTSAMTEDDGTFWFRGEESGTGEVHLLSVERDGTGLTGRAVVGGVLTSGVALLTVDAFAVEPTGVAYALVAGTNLADQRIYLRPTAGAAFVEVMREGDGIPHGAGTLATGYKNGTLNVYAAGQVVWMGIGSGASPDDVFLFGDASGAAGRSLLARSGDTMPGAGGGMLGALGGLNQAPGSFIPQFGAAIVGAGGVTFGTVGVLSQSGPLAFGTAQTQPTDVGPLGATYVGLATTSRPYTEVSQDGSFLFANQLAAGGSALLWMIPSVGVFGLAVEGGPSPDGGDVCGTFAVTSAHTLANGVALFRVPLVTAGSALYRRGP